MPQWKFYFNQDRCLGCKTCVTACKNWNDERRGDKTINAAPADNDAYKKAYEVAVDETEKGDYFVNSATGTTNYEFYRKHYMKEDWRRVEEYETGSVLMDNRGVFESTVDRRYISVSCNHCEDPACIKACPMGIITKEPTYGAVLVSNSGCISCGRCHDACPWGAPQYYDPNYRSYSQWDPKRPKMTKCTMCLDRIKNNLKPACVAACWNRALDAGTIDELQKKYPDALTSLPEFKSDRVEVLGINTKPNILFKEKT
ncbi:MAG: 4Fe-4S dicluster domain-containing protein [Deferribacteraceae bacterium]|jgi:anaerobic dimethyl sulfoxide reductase subunit B (iron-sulfur subunit)|nr:4Fe-4S dicluster domain-containing protein [Deferribacteraceae bacterium]